MNQHTPGRDVYSTLILWVGWIFQAAFLVSAIILYKERVLYADSAYFITEISGTASFYLWHRLIAAFSQFLPVIGAATGASIKTILVLYSMNLALIFIVPFAIITLIYKDLRMTLLLLLLQFVFLYRSHYFTVSELQYALVFLILYWAHIQFLNAKGKSASRNLWSYALLILILNAHPLSLFVLAGTCLVMSTHNSYWHRKDQMVLIPVALVIYTISTLVFHSDYESLIMANFREALFGEFNMYHFRLMISTLSRQYYLTLLTGLLAPIVLFRRYKPWKSVVLVLFLLAFTLSVHLRFSNSTFTLTYFEIYFLPVPLIVFMIIALEFGLERDRMHKIGIVILLLIMLIQSIRILEHRKFYQTRLDVYTGIFDDMTTRNLSKVILPVYKAPMHKIIDYYASPYESYLLSHLDDDVANDGFIITYLPADSVYLDDDSVHIFTYPDDTVHVQYKLEHNAFINPGFTGLNYFPFDHYPRFEIPVDYYKTF
jgi:hypothetical protein